MSNNTKIPTVELGSNQKYSGFSSHGNNYYVDDNCFELMNVITGENQKERAIASFERLLNNKNK